MFAKRLLCALLAVAFVMPSLAVAQDQPKPDEKKEEKKEEKKDTAPAAPIATAGTN